MWFVHPYEHIISVENLLGAWQEFIRGKRKKKDVQEFQYFLMDNIFALHRELKDGRYKHGAYQHFKISDPKPRDIHKATVRDRLVHHALHRQLYPFFDRTWIADSYSCRTDKGTHRAMNRFRSLACGVLAKPGTCWVLKCDVRKFFASIDQTMLLDIVSRYIPDEQIVSLIAEVVGSFYSTEKGKGLPLGNLTSQLLVNVYMNECDQFVKHRLKARQYVRYAHDFMVIDASRQKLEEFLPAIDGFLRERLQLELHPDKCFVKSFASGVDFLGWVHFPDHRVLRTATKRRMLKRAKVPDVSEATLDSYRGMLSHGNARTLLKKLDDSTIT